jgi:hypothetical protein
MERADSGSPTLGWYWNSESGECRVSLPDEREKTTIELQ